MHKLYCASSHWQRLQLIISSDLSPLGRGIPLELWDGDALNCLLVRLQIKHVQDVAVSVEQHDSAGIDNALLVIRKLGQLLLA